MARWSGWAAVLVWLPACGGGDATPSPSPSTGAEVSPSPTVAPPPSVTWHRDVAPLVQASCVGCHKADGIGPFPLETYEEVSPRAGQVAASVEAGRMPPWMPDPSCQSFEDARLLTEEEKGLLRAWADLGAPEGDVADASEPAPPQESLAWVDQTLASAEPFTPSGEVSDEYRCFLLDPELDARTYLVGYEIKPDADPIVHHVLLYAVDREVARALDSDDNSDGVDDNNQEVGWACYGGSGTSDQAVLGGWAPGSPAVSFPEGTGLALAPEQVLVMQLHYNLDYSDPMPDRTQVALQYAREEELTPASFEMLRIGDFKIPAGASDYADTLSYALTSPLVLWGLLPHMHTLGQSYTFSVQRSSGSSSCLLEIPEWDFHWQQAYFYRESVGIPLQKGDTVTMTCVWDNPTDQAVIWGEGTQDEMCITYFYVTR